MATRPLYTDASDVNIPASNGQITSSFGCT